MISVPPRKKRSSAPFRARSNALSEFVGVELDPPFGTEQRRADRTTEVEVEAGRKSPVRRLSNEPRTRDAAAADDAAGLDPIDDRAGVGERREGERKGRDCGSQTDFHRIWRPATAAIARVS